MKTKKFFSILSICVLALMVALPVSAKEKKKKEKAKVTYKIPTMDCKSCEDKINKNIAFEKGVTDLKIDLEKQTVEVTYRKDKTDTKKLAAAFKKIGFETKEVKEGERVEKTNTAKKEHDHKEGEKHED